MTDTRPAVDYAIEVLNRAAEEDEDAIKNLLEHRVICNDALANNSTIQVVDESGQVVVGALGLINGILGIRDNGWGYIAACYEVVCSKCEEKDGAEGADCPTCGSKLELGRLLGFQRTDLMDMLIGKEQEDGKRQQPKRVRQEEGEDVQRELRSRIPIKDLDGRTIVDLHSISVCDEGQEAGAEAAEESVDRDSSDPTRSE